MDLRARVIIGCWPGDGAQVAHGTVDGLGIGSGLADTHVHDDLLKLGDHHDVLVLELVLKLLLDLVVVLGLQTRHILLFCHCSLLLGVLSTGRGHDGLSSCLLAASAPLMAFCGLDSTQQEPTKHSVLYAHRERISRKTSSACTTPQLPRTNGSQKAVAVK